MRLNITGFSNYKDESEEIEMPENIYFALSTRVFDSIEFELTDFDDEAYLYALSDEESENLTGF